MGSKSPRPTRRSSPQKRAKDRGAAFEKKVARLVDGHRHPGFDGDVWAVDTSNRKWMFECKYRDGLAPKSLGELTEFLKQVERYVTNNWQPGQRWGLVMSGGRAAPFRKLSPSGTFILLPIETYMELRDDDRHNH